jgi:hypothetical protein
MVIAMGFEMADKESKDETATSFAIEDHKALIDYTKQLTTLSTGSIVIIAAFVEKVFPQPQWKVLLIVAQRRSNFLPCRIRDGHR